MSETGRESRIIPVNIEEQMKLAYIDYSMSVIVSRALPDVRDGLKPVQRRILFGMYELGLFANKPYKKSARIVGEVLGKYHPHGDSSVYMAMVRMAQDWSLRYTLVDGQGNFGSVDGDSPAAMRYTEARLSKIADEIMSDIDKETVDFTLNFDDSLEEPTVMPTKLPNLLVNGASGIAVGMATNMAPHNLGQVVDAIAAYIDNPEIEVSKLSEIIVAPDFPTGGIIYGIDGVREAYETGRGRVVIRAKTEIEVSEGGREKIIVTEIPYMVNKAELIMKIAELINEKKIEGISDINDESDRNGMRIVIEIKKDAVSNVVLNKLFKYTSLQSSFSINNIALVKGRPMTLTLKDLIRLFVEHRHEIVLRRTEYDLRKAEERAHILEGLIIASDHIDEVISIIRSSESPDLARERLMERFQLTEIQSRAIVEMRLRQLTGLEQDKLRAEYSDLLEKIAYYKEILANLSLRMKIIKEELLELKEKYNDPRKTEIVYSSEELNPEDFYADEDVVITISHFGYIKRTPLTEFRAQNRGGVGSRGTVTRDEDFVEYMFVATMHNTLLLFTKKGKCYWLKVYEIPEGSKTSKGRAIQNLINIEPDDEIKAFMNVVSLTDQEYINNSYIIMCSRNGIIKKTKLAEYSRPRQNGVIALNIREGDSLLTANLIEDKPGEEPINIMIGARNGKVIRFPHNLVRPMGRTATGVKGITLDDDDVVIGLITVKSGQDILVVSENGYGKRSDIEEYRITGRGGKGVKTINITPKTGKLIDISAVTDLDHLMITNRSGIMLRIAVKDLRVMGRATQGVRLINLKDGDQIASVAKIEKGDLEDENENGENNNEFLENHIIENKENDIE
ncbi:MAG: DNA gyrase subunit A [Bacteroidales bacterium]|jgi:DNA gyrase subunit A|nr:DNA gyrase subunit A [Bacteroidales bacterium]HOL97977.1 DNA gyrase subunit A [Bacteroidales bacterium]HOM37509.1 DNA gyrase subunit A [Bacteroidales bacterium]HPD24582.1 DNA gyrase subunit A [Bacteroidales bacterium]HRS99181.1 DNA gyrase subunit A [Bacteroidales bacterium]